MYAVFATLADRTKVKVSDDVSWDRAQGEWRKLDDDRLAGLHPDVRHFEVRDTDDPGYAAAKVSFGHAAPLLRSKGFKHFKDAARKAFLLWQGKPRNGREQGVGGWFYWHNGRPAAQGLDELAKLARQHALVVEGVDGRYYPAVSEL
jgi:hypothetical protein